MRNLTVKGKKLNCLNSFFIVLTTVIFCNSCMTLSSKPTYIRHCVYNYNMIRVDSVYKYLPQTSQKVILHDSMMIWNSYLIILPYSSGELRLIRSDSFYHKDKKIYNILYNHHFLYFDSAKHPLGHSASYYTIQDPKIDTTFLLNRKTIVLVDTAEINGVKAFKGELTYSYIFVGKHEFFSLPSSEIENMDFKFSDKYTVFFNPVLGIIGMSDVGYESSSFYLDSLKTNCEW